MSKNHFPNNEAHANPADARALQRLCGYNTVICKSGRTVDGTTFSMYLSGYVDGFPQFATDVNMAMLFKSKAFAEIKAVSLGDGWHAISLNGI